MSRSRTSSVLLLCLLTLILAASAGGAQLLDRGIEDFLFKTVGTTPGACATEGEVVVGPGTTVYYCYTAALNESEALGYDLMDNVLGNVGSGILPPNTSLEIIVPSVIFENITNVVEGFFFLPNFSEKNVSEFANATVFVDPDLPGGGGFNPAIPTLSEIAMFSFGLLLIVGAFFTIRKTA